MILFTERATYINMFRATMKPKLSVVHLGRIQKISDVWQVRFTGRNWTYYTDLLNGSEKRQIIGMLDKLNQVTGRDQGDMRRRWEEVIRRLPLAQTR
jgi:hypothetical protein